MSFDDVVALVTVPVPSRDRGQTEVTVVCGDVRLIVASFEHASDAIECAKVINGAIAKGRWPS